MILRNGDDPPMPEYLRLYLSGARELFEANAIREMEFSGGTYQVQVEDVSYDPEAFPWAFLQLDARGLIKDSFCSCESVGDEAGCIHIAAAYLGIFNHHKKPLHVRFEESIWNQLGILLAEQYGYGVEKIEETDFEIHFLTAEAGNKYQEILDQRKRETEETSLKFSNLSEEDIILWKEGRPPPKLQYELSLWCDLAKWWMMLQEKGEQYEVRFREHPQRLPSAIEVSFSSLSFSLPLTPELLTSIVPFLSYVKSSIQVHTLPEDEISKITYDVAKGEFSIHGITQEKQKKPKHGDLAIPFGGWIYLPGEGFFAAEAHQLLRQRLFKGEEVPLLFQEHFHLVKEFLHDYELHETPIIPKYSFKFDSQWNLHIEMYLFHPGDLCQKGCRSFGEWVFIPTRGFYHLENALFTEINQIIPPSEVSDFVTVNRSFLNGIEGFQTHLSNIEAQVDYHVDREGRLHFTRVLLEGNENNVKDFGIWIYLAGQGFYAKSQSIVQLPFYPGLILPRDQVSLFIKLNEEELKLLPKFFANQSPISKGGLKVALTKKEGLLIEPLYYFHKEIDPSKVLFYDDYTYREGSGFREIPAPARLPPEFQHQVEVPPAEVEQFMETSYPSIKPLIIDLQKEIQVPDHMQIVVTDLEKKGEDFYLKIKGATELGKVAMAHLWWLRKKKKKQAFSPAGLIPLDHPNLAWLKWISSKEIDRKANVIKMTVFELLRLEALFPLVYASKEAEREVHNLTSFKMGDEPILTDLNSHLRPYQMIGVKWLWFLYRHGMSGLLCDDMGLGKTHQTMALIAAIKNDSSSPSKFLIICPTSVIYHWQEKLEQYLPGFKICTFHGANRSSKELNDPYDILLTSYGIWRNEQEMLEKIQFDLAVFDEVQLAKNHQSRLYNSLQGVKGRMRLGLTGTPIENQLRELKALFDLVLPGYMLTDGEFQSYFVKPIERESNLQKRRQLQRLIRPFVMRRKKEDVLQDLPEKIEEVIHCEMIDSQEHLYHALLKSSRDKILSELSDGKAPIPYIHIFALLSQLKMVCDHPAVFHKTPWEYRKYESGKWELFLELLEEARDSRQKIVVFSQYLGMLDIIEEHLKENHIGYATIRGSTINRSEQLIKFKEDPTCEVFVASLQAAGLGIDLTSASVVIHYDRWWNAARENQATDRVHRIGQKRGVQVFKLVTKDSFEERIDKLIQRKGALMEDVIGVDDHQVLKSFTRDELLELLQISS